MMLLSESVHKATGAPLRNVRTSWPAVYAALRRGGMDSLPSQIGAVATIAVECPPFMPISEWGEHPEYDTGPKAKRLGNTPEPDGDGQRYEGRGFIQLTGRANYYFYGGLLKVDLIAHPERALEPGIAASIFALYWKQRKIAPMCERGDWKAVRRAVNGGLTHYDRFFNVVKALDPEATP